MAKTTGELKRQKKKLLNQLGKIEKQLQLNEGATATATAAVTGITTAATATAANSSRAVGGFGDGNSNSNIPTLTEKSGYLYKWQDRTIGWSGTKWDLRFVRLANNGRLSYYRTHNDSSPRYILTLRNCAVRDDGYKPNKRYKYWKRRNQDTTITNTSTSASTVDMQTPGAYYHVFSIYQRPEVEVNGEEEDDIIPLLRFSTQSYAEKSLWLEQISDACAFCDTDEFLKLEKESAAAAAAASSSTSGTILTSEAAYKSGTLPPMFFAPAPPKISRLPSNHNLGSKKTTRRKSYVQKSTRKDAHKTHLQRKNDYAPSRPMHRSTSPSYLSDEAPMQNYRGLLNLGLIILVISNFRILLSTMQQYGFVVVDWLTTMESVSTYWKAATMVDYPLLTGLGLLFFFVNYAYLIELFTCKKIWPEWVGLLLHVINTNLALIVPTVIVWYQIESIISGMVLMMCAVILWMKLISYAHANADYRNHPESSDLVANIVRDIDDVSKTCTYPQNITLPNIYYFWVAPTLTYQIAFPCLMRRNWLRIFTLIIRLFLSNVLIIFIIAQVVSPSLQSLIQDLESGKQVFSVEIFADYLLKLGMASTYIWLLVFYSYFHVFFNLLAELLKFGDRVFYRDWWNSSNVSAYWRLWNLPVHYWLIRHLYFPLIRLGINKTGAMIAVFFFSAIMHEYVISIPFHMIRPWSFLGMMGQIPLVAITKYFDKLRPGSSIGNMIFWLTFCIIGQPMAILMYTIDYYNIKNYTATETECVGSACGLRGEL